MSLLRMSLSGTLLILVIAVIRSVLINRLPKRTFTLLWGVALLRLLLPFSIPSKWSIYTWLGHGRSMGTVIPNSHISALLSTAEAPLPAPDATGIYAGRSVWAVIWTAGLAVCALYFASAYILSYWRFRTSVPVNNAFTAHWLRTHGLRRPIAIRQSSRISSPLTYGMLRPVILIPAGISWENREPLNYFLEHEYVHIRRNDFATKLLLTAALCIHWFNPAVWIMYILCNRDIELVCDEAVIQKTGLSSRAGYATALLDLEEHRSTPPSLCNYFSKNAIEERIVAIMKSKHYSFHYQLLSVLLVLCAVLVFSTSAQASAIGNDSSTWMWPTLSKEVTLGFGEHTHPITGAIFNYDHIYIAGTAGDAVVSSTDGIISKTGYDAQYGYYIVVSAANDTHIVYGQLRQILVEAGTSVTAGEQIGELGRTGAVVGDCLSYAVFTGGVAVDPLEHIG